MLFERMGLPRHLINLLSCKRLFMCLLHVHMFRQMSLNIGNCRYKSANVIKNQQMSLKVGKCR